MLDLNKQRGICMSILFILCLPLSNSQNNNRDYSSSQSPAVIKNLLKTERLLINIIEEELLSLQSQRDILHRFLDDIYIAHEKSENDPEEYLSIPQNSFALIRRTHEGWSKIVKYLEKPSETVNKINALSTVKFPTRGDLQEAVIGMEQLRRTSDLNTMDSADMQFKLSSFNLFTIGFELYKLEKYDAAIFWLNQSLHAENQSLLPREFSGFDTVNTYLLYVKTLLQLDRESEAVDAAKKALALYPENDLVVQMNNVIKEKLLTAHLHSVLNSTDFELCCRESCQQRNNGLHCRYNTSMSLYHILAPSKMEEISLDPYIVVFHDVLTEDEIQSILDSARKEFSSAEIFTEESEVKGDKNHTPHEVSVLLRNDTIQKIAAITGLDSTGFETSVVHNYSLTEKYGVHSDFFQPKREKSLRTEGDRIATISIHLSDVKQGGATAFPGPKLAVIPQKSSLLLWHNLKNSGKADVNTVHGACPVIAGSKYVLTIWVRERAQFRKLPCYNL